MTYKRRYLFVIFVTILVWIFRKKFTALDFYSENFTNTEAGKEYREFESLNNDSYEQTDVCIRPEEATNYTICEKLPFSDTFCGEEDCQRNLLKTSFVCSVSLPTDNSNDNSQGTAKKINGSYYPVPNIVHYVWLGDNMTFKYYHYLSVRSAAAVQKPMEILFHINSTKPRGHWWEKIASEVPCLRTLIVDSPTSIFGNKVDYVIHQTDIARNLILMRYGGIYLDSDAIVLKSLDPLRKYKFTIGRSTEFSLSNGVMLSERHGMFLQAWTDLYKTFDKERIKGTNEAEFAIKVPFKLHLARPGLACHVEETSMQRPNPWVDGRSCITHGNIDISNNYILHLHPTKSLKRDPTILLEYTTDELRTYDTTYGAGARVALFGTQDLIYLKSDAVPPQNRKPTSKIAPYRAMETYIPDPNWSAFN